MNGIPSFSDERQTAGRKWLHGFLLRHPDITLKKAHNLSIARAMGANPTVIRNWFKLLKDVKDTAGIISPDQIWSGDKTGIQNVLKEMKVLGMKHIRTFQQVSSEQGETLIVLSFISAGGKVCPPLVIHKGQRVQETWRLKAPGDIQLSATTKAYITKSRFHQYGVHFIKYLKKEGLANKKNLLIVDGHKSHLYNLPFYEAMRANGIEVLTIPPHTSHVLQPLDSVPFAQFKKNWEKNLRRYNTTHSGRSLNKIDFWEVFSPSWNQAMTTKNIMAGFRSTGIYPYDPLAIPPSSMAPSEVTDYGEKSCFWCWFWCFFNSIC